MQRNEIQPNRSYESLRQQVLRRDGWRCQSCGTMSNLEVPHREFRSHSGDDSEQNLITLCSTCHATLHQRGSETDRAGTEAKSQHLQMRGTIRQAIVASLRGYSNSVTGKARNPSAIGKLFDVRQTIAPLAIRDFPTTLRTKSRFVASLAVGTSVHSALRARFAPPATSCSAR